MRTSHKYLRNWMLLGGFPGGASGKEPACQCRRCRFNPWVGNILWRRKWQPTSVFLPWKSHGRGAWQATVHGVTKSRTRLKRLNTMLLGMVMLETAMGATHPILTKHFTRSISFQPLAPLLGRESSGLLLQLRTQSLREMNRFDSHSW